MRRAGVSRGGQARADDNFGAVGVTELVHDVLLDTCDVVAHHPADSCWRCAGA